MQRIAGWGQKPVIVVIKRFGQSGHRFALLRPRLDCIGQFARESAEQAVRLVDDIRYGRRVGAPLDIDFSRDQLVGEDQAGIALGRRFQDLDKLGQIVGLAPKNQRTNRPVLGLVLPEAMRQWAGIRRRWLRVLEHDDFCNV